MAEHGGKEDDLNILSALREPLEEEQLKEDAHGLPVKYQGTRADQQDMMVLGKKQVLRVCTCLCASIYQANAGCSATSSSSPCLDLGRQLSAVGKLSYREASLS
jgi:hypothetical protein